MPSSNFDKDIKRVPTFGTLNTGNTVRRALTLSNASSGTGQKAATKNIMGHQ